MNLDSKTIMPLNKKHSELVQNKAFELGYDWEGDYSKTVYHAGSGYPINIQFNSNDKSFKFGRFGEKIRLKDLKEMA